MASPVDELVLEVAPGELKRVATCSDTEIISAGLLLIVNDAPDDVWDEHMAVLVVVAAHRLMPTADERRRQGVAPLINALKRLPFEVRQEVGPALRAGIDANNAAAD